MDVKSKENEKLKQELTEKSWTMVDSCVQPDLVQLKMDNVPIDSTVGDNNSITKDSEREEEFLTCETCRNEYPESRRLLFIPCGHGCCSDCASQLKNCHACKEKIVDTQVQFS